MSIFSSLFGWMGFGSGDSLTSNNEPDINPATGLPMVGGVDVEGNPYGTDIMEDSGMDMVDDGMSMMDDSFDDW